MTRTALLLAILAASAADSVWGQGCVPSLSLITSPNPSISTQYGIGGPNASNDFTQSATYWYTWPDSTMLSSAGIGESGKGVVSYSSCDGDTCLYSGPSVASCPPLFQDSERLGEFAIVHAPGICNTYTIPLSCQFCPPKPFLVQAAYGPMVTSVLDRHTCQCSGTQACSTCNQSSLQWTSNCTSSQTCTSIGACCASTLGTQCGNNNCGLYDCSGNCANPGSPNAGKACGNNQCGTYDCSGTCQNPGSSAAGAACGNCGVTSCNGTCDDPCADDGGGGGGGDGDPCSSDDDCSYGYTCEMCSGACARKQAADPICDTQEDPIIIDLRQRK